MMQRSPTETSQYRSDPNIHTAPDKTWISSRLNKKKRDFMEDSDSDTSETSRRYKSTRCSPLSRINETLNIFREELKSMHNLLNTMKEEQETNYVQIKSDISEIKSDILHMKNKNLESEKVIEEMNTKFKDLNNKQHDLTENSKKQENKIKDLNQKYTKLENELQDLTTNIHSLQHQYDMKDQRERLNNLEVIGIPYTNSENLNSILQAICIKIGVTLVPADIDQIHRVRKFPTTMKNNTDSPPNIIIHFTQRRRKNEFLAAFKTRRTITTVDLGLNGPSRPVFINEHLTPRNKLLLKKVRDVGKEMSYKFIWIKDCKIFLRKSETSRIIHISDTSDISKIK